MVRKTIPDMTEEVTAFGFGLDELLVLIGGEGEIAISVTAVEAEVKHPARCNVCRGSQELGFDWLPVQTLCVIRDSPRSEDKNTFEGGSVMPPCRR